MTWWQTQHKTAVKRVLPISGTFQLANTFLSFCRCNQFFFIQPQNNTLSSFSPILCRTVSLHIEFSVSFLHTHAFLRNLYRIKMTTTPFIILTVNAKEKLNPPISALKIENTQKTKPKNRLKAVKALSPFVVSWAAKKQKTKNSLNFKTYYI